MPTSEAKRLLLRCSSRRLMHGLHRIRVKDNIVYDSNTRLRAHHFLLNSVHQAQRHLKQTTISHYWDGIKQELIFTLVKKCEKDRLTFSLTFLQSASQASFLFPDEDWEQGCSSFLLLHGQYTFDRFLQVEGSLHPPGWQVLEHLKCLHLFHELWWGMATNIWLG